MELLRHFQTIIYMIGLPGISTHKSLRQLRDLKSSFNFTSTNSPRLNENYAELRQNNLEIRKALKNLNLQLNSALEKTIRLPTVKTPEPQKTPDLHILNRKVQMYL